jgi:hypothetical protein
MAKVDEATNLQEIGLDEMKKAGLDENNFTILRRRPGNNSTVDEARKYPSQTIKGLAFFRRTILTENGNPTFVGWAVRAY